MPAAALLACAPVVAQVPGDADVSDGDAIIVYGRALPQIGKATTGSSGTVGYRDIEDRPIARVGELAENVPGLVATQHSGSGKANQYFLRGFNLDHGTDLAGFVDGVPINLRSHGHGQGYLDLGFLIPELVRRIDYRKGPYFVDGGDFSAAGTIRFQTADRLARPLAELTAGSFGYARALAAGSIDRGDTTVLAALEAVRSDGPWVLDERLRKINGLVKLSRGDGGGQEEGDGSSLALGFYHADWTSTDQVPLRAIRDGRIGRRGFVDPDLGGRTTRASATYNLSSGDWQATGYAVLYDFALVSNFTYFLDDPVGGDEFRQRDRRSILGGSVQRKIYGGLLGAPAAFTLGAEARYDRIGKVGLYRSQAGRPVSTVREDRVDEGSAALYGEAMLWPAPKLRLSFGVRADLYRYDVRSDLAANSGKGTDALLAPKAGLAWNLAPPVELYLNYGEGFHSNDVRGATIRTDPASGDPADRVGVLVRAKSAEIGARFERPAFTASIAAFRLTLGSELLFVGDGGGTEPGAASRRTGVEATAFWRPRRGIAFDLSAAATHARLRGTAPGEDRIPNAVSHVLAAGVSVDPLDAWTLSLRLRHLGAAPLIEDGSVRSRATSLVNLGSYWRIGRARLGLDILNLLDSKANDISYFYASRLPGEPAEGVEDRHVHPVEPRQARLSLRYSL